MTDKELNESLARAEAAWSPTAPDFTGLDEVVAAAVLTDDVPALVAEIRRLRGEVETLRSTLAVIASHDPSWSDDFCRARAALGMKP